jgi:hypothetical protein
MFDSPLSVSHSTLDLHAMSVLCVNTRPRSQALHLLRYENPEASGLIARRLCLPVRYLTSCAPTSRSLNAQPRPVLSALPPVSHVRERIWPIEAGRTNTSVADRAHARDAERDDAAITPVGALFQALFLGNRLRFSCAATPSYAVIFRLARHSGLQRRAYGRASPLLRKPHSGRVVALGIGGLALHAVLQPDGQHARVRPSRTTTRSPRPCSRQRNLSLPSRRRRLRDMC